MTKKEKEKGLTYSLKEFAKSFLINSMKGIFDNVMQTLKQEILDTKKKILRSVFIFLLLFAGIFFIFLGGVFLINQYTKLGFGWSFVIIGLLILVFSMFMKFIFMIQEKR